MSILALAIATLAMTQSSSATIEAREADRLEACVAKIEVDAEEAYEDGLAWIYQGNRPGARQCTAMALIALGLVLALGIFWGFLEMFKVVPHVWAWWVLPAWAIALKLARLGQNARGS